MTKQEIDNLIKEGTPLVVQHGLKRVFYYIGEKKLTDNQYNSAKKRFEGELEMKSDFSGLTKHIYTIKKLKYEKK